MCKTNPIWPRQGRVPPGERCKTNPISGGRNAPPFQYSTIPAFQSDADRAKRTQFLPRCRSGDRRSREGKWCETNPIGPLEGVGRGRPTHEEPMGNRAKRSQLAVGEPLAGIPNYSSIPLFHHSNAVPVVRNKANSSHDADREIGVPGGRACETKPISTASDMGPPNANCCVWEPLELAGCVGYHSYPGNRPYTD